MKARNIRIQKNKGRGRPPKPGGLDQVVSSRLPADLISAIEAWADRNEVGSRQAAVRRLIEIGLASSKS